MNKKHSAGEKIAIIRQVLVNKQSAYSVTRDHNISKTTFYNWLRTYKNGRKNQESALTSKVRQGNNHYKSLTAKQKQAILSLVHKKPKLSSKKVAQLLSVGNHAVQNLLYKEGLNLLRNRQEFSNQPFWKREAGDRRQAMMELKNQGWKISDICKHFKISKPTFYKWKERFDKAEDSVKAEALEDRFVAGDDHHKYMDEKKKAKILSLVGSNPSWSVHKIYSEMPKENGQSIVGHHGIQNILERNNLNTYEKRLAWVQPQPIVEPVQIPIPAPTQPRKKLIQQLSPFKSIPKLFIQQPVTWPVAIPIILFVAYIFEVDKIFRPTVFFPIIALTFGLLFFLYSMKYYASLLVVLWLGKSKDNIETSSRISFFNISNYIKNKIRASNSIGSLEMVEDISNIQLKRKPYLSVQVPIYNEKKVVLRMLKAATSFDWKVYDEKQKRERANWELIIADDSNDETTEIAKKYLSSDGRYLVEKFKDSNLEIFLSKTHDGSGPVVKYIHRFKRTGYKGAALAKALEITEKIAEYVVIFDADFVPYPDTLEQFVKHFAVIDKQENLQGNKIAAVQGYQWHVLNKSQNWITRGVRSEYAGSYVVERSAVELYGGLKMIAGSVYAIRRNILDQIGWGTSITEDLELTLKLYSRGYKVAFTPYIQAPAEAVSTMRRLIRQRMRWAEGHSFNIKKNFNEITRGKQLTFREKLEYAFLAPYYMQAAFFIFGTFAWFMSEIVFQVSLPFWTAAFGWSLVFSNFLALPLINLLGLFLEQSDEKDYIGVASFVLLSYLVAPFQAYAAIKGYIEKEEGPWFRTPKTGIVTDAFGRLRIGGFEISWPFGKPAVASEAVSNSLINLPNVSSFNPLTGYKIKPRRFAFASRSVIAIFMAIIMAFNYLAFFASPAPVEATGTAKIEQHINLLGDTAIRTADTYGPTDNSLGLFLWDEDKYSDNAGIYFEAVLKNSDGSTAWAALFDESGTRLGPESFCAVSANATIVRDRSILSLDNGICSGGIQDDTQYTVRIRSGGTSDTVTIYSARIIILQVGVADASITDSETAVEVGSVQSAITGTDYAILDDPKYYCYGSTATGTSCTDQESTIWSPVPTVTFAATLQVTDGSDTAYAELWNGSTQVAEVTHTGNTNWTRVEDTSVTLSGGTEYHVRVKCSGESCSASITNAHILLYQSNPSGISALETIQHYNTSQISSETSTPAKVNGINNWDDANFGQDCEISCDINAYFESVIGVDDTNGRAHAELCIDLSDCTGSNLIGEVTSSSTTMTRTRAALDETKLPTAATDLDAVLWCLGTNDTATCTDVKNAFTDASSWLIIQLSSIPVPEAVVFMLPLLMFIPKLIKLLKDRDYRKKKFALWRRKADRWKKIISEAILGIKIINGIIRQKL